MSRAREVVEILTRALVDQKDDIEIHEKDLPGSNKIIIKTAQGDLGKLIGREGRTAAAIRKLVDVAAEVDGRRTMVDFVDD